MDTLYNAISDLLDGLIPSALLSDFQGLNDFLAYILTVSLIYGLLIRPIFKLIKVVK